jgi:acetyl esterase/lipase
MKRFLALLPLFCLPAMAYSQTNSNMVIQLWPQAAPGALGTADKDIPTLTVFLPEADKATGAAMVICPGGGYGGLAQHEGRDYALWLNANGVTCFVLKYRLGSAGYRHPVELGDAARAMRLVRARAAEWNVDTKRIGIIGSSAGGHLASTLLTHFDAGNPDATDPIDRQSSRPDLGILCYPVITMGEKTHAGSRDNLLGKNPSPELIQELSNELHVTKETPPCFLFHTVEDNAVPVENSLQFAAALRRAGVPFDLHIYEAGRHGSGLGGKPYSKYDPATLHPWTRDCIFWLKQHGYVK